VKRAPFPPPAKRTVRVATTLTRSEAAMLRKVQRYVWSFTGDRTTAEALRFLVRNWEQS
jgi:hypothetical protein